MAQIRVGNDGSSLILPTFCGLIKWPRSLMDRMEDSGSSDRGSNPFGVTKPSHWRLFHFCAFVYRNKPKNVNIILETHTAHAAERPRFIELTAIIRDIKTKTNPIITASIR